MTIQETLDYMFSITALDILIDDKYNAHEAYSKGLISYKEYKSFCSYIQEKIDVISPIDISFI